MSRKKKKRRENQDLGLVSFFLGLDSDLVSFLGLDSEVDEESEEESEDVAEESLESELEEESPESSLDSPPDFFL